MLCLCRLLPRPLLNPFELRGPCALVETIILDRVVFNKASSLFSITTEVHTYSVYNSHKAAFAIDDDDDDDGDDGDVYLPENQ